MKPTILLIGDATPRMLERLSQTFVVREARNNEVLERVITEHGSAIEGAATFAHDGLRAQTIDRLPNLKAVSCYGVGYDAIDVKRCLERGVVISHTPTVLNDDVANTAIMLMLATSRELILNDRWVRSGKWESEGNTPLSRSIEGAHVGMLGLGRIGEVIALKLAAFTCDVSYHTRSEKPESGYRYYGDLSALASDCDYLIAIVPGGASTHHIINRTILEALGPQGTLINVARGSVVDEKALIEALSTGKLGAAGLDVFEDEPHVPQALRNMDNVVLTPHIASATVETRRAMGDLTVDNLVEFFAKGKLLTPVPECQP